MLSKARITDLNVEEIINTGILKMLDVIKNKYYLFHCLRQSRYKKLNYVKRFEARLTAYLPPRNSNM